MSRISRRRLLAAAGVSGTALAGGAAVFLSRRDALAPGPAGEQPTPPVAGATPPPSPTPLPRGGTVALATTAGFDFDTFDALRSGEPSVVELLGRVHARLLQWADPASASLGADLAAAWEQPDDTTIVLRLAAARWHDRAPLHGRRVTASDVRHHLDRGLAIARAGAGPVAQRTAPLRDIARIEDPDPATVRIVLARPAPLLLAALAGEYALVQAAETTERPAASDPLDLSLLVGCGPWTFEAFRDDGVSLRAHADGHRPPLLDGLLVAAPFAPFERYQAGVLDEFPTFDPREAAAARTLPGVQEHPMLQREIVLSTFVTSAPPWSDARLVEALSAALNRGWLADALFAGRARPSGPLPPVFGAALPDAELASAPGYAPDPDADARDARERWQAAAGPTLGPITIDFPSIFDPRYAASAVVIDRLNAVLGPQFRPAVETYTTIARRVHEGFYGNGRAATWLGWGPPLPSPDPREALLDLYGGTFAARERERLLAATPEAHEAARELQRAILADGFRGCLPWTQQVIEVFRRPGTFGPEPSPFWDGQRDVQRHRAG
jgi:ABC-type transport system substrate-binding protein